MIRYSPPKSQVWGHQVGRLSATTIVERSRNFLQNHGVVFDAPQSELLVSWNDGPHAQAAEDVIRELGNALNQPTTVTHLPHGPGQPSHHYHWSFPSEGLAVVATCFDQLSAAIKAQDITAQSSTIWSFAWRNEPAPLLPMTSAGGLFGIHLGLPHRITTAFTFRDLEQYAGVKAALCDLELVELADKHLRPRVDGPAGKRRAK